MINCLCLKKCLQNKVKQIFLTAKFLRDFTMEMCTVKLQELDQHTVSQTYFSTEPFLSFNQLSTQLALRNAVLEAVTVKLAAVKRYITLFLMF